MARGKPFSEDITIRDIDLSGVAETRLKDARFRTQKDGIKEENRIRIVDPGYRKK